MTNTAKNAFARAQTAYDNMQHPSYWAVPVSDEEIKEERDEVLKNMHLLEHDEGARIQAALISGDMQEICEELIAGNTVEGIARFLTHFAVCMKEVAEQIAIENLEGEG